MLSSSPSRFQSTHGPRTDPRTMRRPRTWQMFSFIRLRMRVPIGRGPHQSRAVPLQARMSRIDTIPASPFTRKYTETKKKEEKELYVFFLSDEISAALYGEAKVRVGFSRLTQRDIRAEQRRLINSNRLVFSQNIPMISVHLSPVFSLSLSFACSRM